jgi:hypothetical protein
MIGLHNIAHRTAGAVHQQIIRQGCSFSPDAQMHAVGGPPWVVPQHPCSPPHDAAAHVARCSTKGNRLCILRALVYVSSPMCYTRLVSWYYLAVASWAAAIICLISCSACSRRILSRASSCTAATQQQQQPLCSAHCLTVSLLQDLPLSSCCNLIQPDAQWISQHTCQGLECTCLATGPNTPHTGLTTW